MIYTIQLHVLNADWFAAASKAHPRGALCNWTTLTPPCGCRLFRTWACPVQARATQPQQAACVGWPSYSWQADTTENSLHRCLVGSAVGLLIFMIKNLKARPRAQCIRLQFMSDIPRRVKMSWRREAPLIIDDLSGPSLIASRTFTLKQNAGLQTSVKTSQAISRLIRFTLDHFNKYC